MFTGIVEETGILERLERRGGCARIFIRAEKILEGTKIGDSISVSGVCLTAVAVRPGSLVFEAIARTLAATTLGFLRSGEAVNLERALKAGDRIGGHFVTGHVDCVGVVRSRIMTKGNIEFRIGTPTGFAKFLVPRGSVAVDGVSLTVVAAQGSVFSVSLIPHTAGATALAKKKAGSRVNVEFDMLIKGRA